MKHDVWETNVNQAICEVPCTQCHFPMVLHVLPGLARDHSKCKESHMAHGKNNWREHLKLFFEMVCCEMRERQIS